MVQHDPPNTSPLPPYVNVVFPADIVKQGDSVLLLGSYAPSVKPPPVTEPNKAPKWQNQIWGNAAITEEKIQEIEENLVNDNINCAGDGSVKRDRAAHASCVFRKDNHEILLRGSATVNGDYDHTTLMRPETISR